MYYDSRSGLHKDLWQPPGPFPCGAVSPLFLYIALLRGFPGDLHKNDVFPVAPPPPSSPYPFAAPILPRVPGYRAPLAFPRDERNCPPGVPGKASRSPPSTPHCI